MSNQINGPSNIIKTCPISGDNMREIFRKKVLGKYEVGYYYCSSCGIIQTEAPYWFTEAYSSAITSLDIGLVDRNVRNANRLAPLLHHFSDGKRRIFVDIGGGYGLLTRLLRDRGFDVFSEDPFCENIFAKGFEGSGRKADVLFAFEVFEHLENPVQFLEDAFKKYSCRTIIFSTVVFSGDAPPADWWYYSFETGQHISFYQPKSLEALARKFNCHYYSMGRDLHIITDIRINSFYLALYHNKWTFNLLQLYTRFRMRHKSLLLKDYESARRQLHDRSDEGTEQAKTNA